jgi:uncharacterized Zn finger protein (UPF0148 family)
MMMARETNCPSCGAPLEYGGDLDEVVCGFCGAKVKVEEDAEQAHFQVLEKPGPQSELLSQMVEPAAKPEPKPDEIQFKFGEPVSYEPDSVKSGAQVLPGSAAPYTPVSSVGQPAKPTNWGRWVAIGAVVLIGLCLVCACAVGAMILLANSGSYTY